MTTNTLIADSEEWKEEFLKSNFYETWYIWRWLCANCGKFTNGYIRKGVQVSTIDLVCPNCGCKVKGQS